MAAVKLEQYLASILDSTKSDTNEVKIKPKNINFDLFRVFLENRNTGVHRYQTTASTILYEARGSVKARINDQNFLLKAGNIVFLQRKSNYEILQQGENDILVKLEFNRNFKMLDFLGNYSVMDSREKKVFKAITDAYNQKRLLFLNGTALSISANVLKKVIDEYLNQDLYTRQVILAELNLLLIVAVRNQDLATAPVTNHQFVQTDLENYIDAHFTDITLNDTAKHFGFNPNYFSSLVKQKTGKSFVEHVDERRMQEARNLLARPDISVKEIIARVGYSGKSFFYKKFSEYYHETPVQMRAELFRQANINLK